jgi:hypothetical protein
VILGGFDRCPRTDLKRLETDARTWVPDRWRNTGMRLPLAGCDIRVGSRDRNHLGGGTVSETKGMRSFSWADVDLPKHRVRGYLSGLLRRWPGQGNKGKGIRVGSIGSPGRDGRGYSSGRLNIAGSGAASR